MKNYLKHIVAVMAVIVLSYTLNAVPPGSDSQHIRYTAIEEVVIPPTPPPGWQVFTVRKTFSIPSLKVDELVLYITWSYLEMPGEEEGAFSMHGVGSIFSEVDEWIGEEIGALSFVNAGMYLSGPPVSPLVHFVTDGTVVGTIWAGPLAGLVLVENASLDVVIDYSDDNHPEGIPRRYDSFHVGFMLPSAAADLD